ncbi:MAG: hypothetical protein Q4B96_04415 [Bacillota bacterium]|nr:hypothetical protein [Bacillota bacterium]
MEMSENIGLATLLKDMEEAISNASRVPLSNKVMVDRDEMLEFVDKVYEVLPEEIKQARKVLENSDRLIESVEDQGKRILAEAQEKAQLMIRETEIYRSATAQAEAILSEAEAMNMQMRTEAVQYCDDLFAQLQNNLDKALADILKNREDLGKFKYYNKE